MQHLARLALTFALACEVVACPQETSFVERYADYLPVPDTSCVLERLESIAASNPVQYIQDHIALGTNHRFQFNVSLARAQRNR